MFSATPKVGSQHRYKVILTCFDELNSETANKIIFYVTTSDNIAPNEDVAEFLFTNDQNDITLRPGETFYRIVNNMKFIDFEKRSMSLSIRYSNQTIPNWFTVDPMSRNITGTVPFDLHTPQDIQCDMYCWDPLMKLWV